MDLEATRGKSPHTSLPLHSTPLRVSPPELPFSTSALSLPPLLLVVLATAPP